MIISLIPRTSNLQIGRGSRVRRKTCAETHYMDTNHVMRSSSNLSPATARIQPHKYEFRAYLGHEPPVIFRSALRKGRSYQCLGRMDGCPDRHSSASSSSVDSCAFLSAFRSSDFSSLAFNRAAFLAAFALSRS